MFFFEISLIMAHQGGHEDQGAAPLLTIRERIGTYVLENRVTHVLTLTYRVDVRQHWEGYAEEIRNFIRPRLRQGMEQLLARGVLLDGHQFVINFQRTGPQSTKYTTSTQERDQIVAVYLKTIVNHFNTAWVQNQLQTWIDELGDGLVHPDDLEQMAVAFFLSKPLEYAGQVHGLMVVP